ncbi:shikimate dehydrogenase [Nocardioides limicola]|uniref:shikimate dehydrogenase n=1 Tax=Nocardioides limicola TaxID=2803368 RepID=UPI00193C25A1|nr:shikimate dehydrogenase [Nocardioides sp. DJM-14]
MRRRCAVLGDPIDHSLSPVLHRAGYAALGLDWTYDAHRVPAGGLADFVGGLDDGWRGLSLTMPLKREALPLVDQVTDGAAVAGAANTIVLDDDGRTGHNTDVPGAAAALRERYQGPLRRAAILGGGATAASTLLAVADLGCRDFALHVRNPERAAETLEAAARHRADLDVTVAALTSPPEADLLISTIPAAAQDPALVAGCARVPVLFEVLYHPWPTPLAASAGDRVLISGLDLLVHQAALQFELFTGQSAPLDRMRAAGESALAARQPG